MTRPKPQFLNPVKDNEHKALDGDTVRLMLDRGWREKKRTDLRLAGLDTPESFRPKSTHKVREKEVGFLVKEIVKRWLAGRAEECQFYATSEKKPKYAGRTIGTLHTRSPDLIKPGLRAGERLNDYLLGHHLAKPYEGGKRSWTLEELESIASKAAAILQNQHSLLDDELERVMRGEDLTI